MDLYDAKDRIAVALVESVFRRARYRVRPFQNEPGLRFIRDDWTPSFHAALAADDGNEREFLIEVTYRPFVEQFIALENQRRDASVFVLARQHWPALRSVVVTDHPEQGRSGFQALGPRPPRRDDQALVDDATVGDDVRTVRAEKIEGRVIGRRPLPGEIPGAPEQQRPGAHRRERARRAPRAQIRDAPLVVDELARAEAPGDVQQVEVAQVLVHRVGLHHEPVLVGDLGRGADDAVLHRGIDAERGHAAKRVVPAHEVQQGQAREDQKRDARDHVMDHAMRNATAAARPPMITVWTALRSGGAPVNRALVEPNTASAHSVTTVDTPSAVEARPRIMYGQSGMRPPTAYAPPMVTALRRARRGSGRSRPSSKRIMKSTQP